MSNSPNTAFLRLEGPLQAWGDNSKFVIRRTKNAPTKSAVLGLICCAMGIPRGEAGNRLAALNHLSMAARFDRTPNLWWDYHTVGARYGVLSAEGSPKKTAATKEHETLVTRREYLADASYLVALHGEPSLLDSVLAALHRPRWTLYLGRKSCPPTAPIHEGEGHFPSLRDALQSQPWHARNRDEFEAVAAKTRAMARLDCLIEWRPSEAEATAPDSAEIWYDVPVSFAPPVHRARLVIRSTLEAPIADAYWNPPQGTVRPRADYANGAYKLRRQERLAADQGLCVFCKSPATTVQHITYIRAGGSETLGDLRALCRLCHDAVTMIEYGLGMGLDRIDPLDLRWRQSILEKRDQIVHFRSLRTRRLQLESGMEG